MEENQNNFFKKLTKKQKTITLIVLLLVVAVTVVTIVFATYISKNRYEINANLSLDIDVADRIVVNIPKGAATGDIAKILKNIELIDNEDLFKFLSMIAGYDGKYKYGSHIISKELDYFDIMRVLVGNATYIPKLLITIPENYTFMQTAEKLAGEKVIDINKFINVANTAKFDYKFMKNLPKRKYRVEGYLFPETYSFDGDLSEKQVIEIFLKQFNKIFKDEYYKRAEELNMTVDEIITLASIIERESKRADERALISGVFHNRLKSESLKKLQSCATIQYVLLNQGKGIHEIITYDDMKIDDLYNTYVYEGLPPGPICSPGEASIIAALYPQKTNYLYFVAKEDGTGGHYFSETYQEHLQAQAKAENDKKNQ